MPVMPVRLRPSPALFVAVLALVVALGGTTYASVTINGSGFVTSTTASPQSFVGRVGLEPTTQGL
jgi:hypothetical protein